MTALEKIANSFQTHGTLQSIQQSKNGHINDSYVANYQCPTGTKRYFFQKINQYVFKDVKSLMRNIQIVTAHVRSKLKSWEKTLTIIPTKQDQLFLDSEHDGAWRCYDFIEGGISLDNATNREQAYEAALCFARFLSYLSDLDVAQISESIPDFQNTKKRFDALQSALKLDACSRKASCLAEVNFALAREKEGTLLIEGLSKGLINRRVTHNDLKLNNLLFEKSSMRGMCVVDLDTCMPGSLLFDFGDLARNSSVNAAEDEVNLSKVVLNLEMYQAVYHGFLEGAGNLLNGYELKLLPMAPRLLALTLGVRFLSDYLIGDKYFKISRAEHNLERARVQFKIVQEFEEKVSS